jgi:hypothetical protein
LEIEIKIVKYVLLTYIIYGVMNIFILNNFVVPLPIIYFAVPLIAVYFFWLSIRSRLSWFLIALPFIVIKDVLMDFNVNLVAILSIISLVSWVLFGFLILQQKWVVSPIQKVYGIVLIVSVFTLLPTTFNLTWIILPLIGFFGFFFLKSVESKFALNELKDINRQLDTTSSDIDDVRFLKNSETNVQLTFRRINLLIILISSFYLITLFSIWTNTL